MNRTDSSGLPGACRGFVPENEVPMVARRVAAVDRQGRAGPFATCHDTVMGGMGRAGRLAQLVERLLYTQDVGGSSPSPPTSLAHESLRRSILRTTPYALNRGLAGARTIRA